MKKIFALTLIYAIFISSAYASVEINETNFPDETFRAVIGNGDTITKNGTLDDDEISEMTIINVEGRNISSLKGIEYLTSLKTLYCDNNTLESLDLSKNLNLETLYCTNNAISSLNINNCNKLKELYCYTNQIENLDLLSKTELISLDCQENKLKNLDVSKNTMLEFLDCSSNDITSLNLTSNPSLKSLYCHDLNLSNSGLDISNQKDLRQLWCWNDGLKNLNLTDNINLRSIRADDNLLSDIDLTNQFNLSELSLSGNNITSAGVIKSMASFTQNGNSVTFNDIGDFDNIPISSIKGYASNGELLNLLSFNEGTATFASAPEIVSYEYQTGIETLKLKAASTSGNTDTIAMANNGIFSGTEEDGIISWKGIPYAKAPVESLRWKAPESPDESAELFIANEFAPAALQPASAFTPASQSADMMNEDCLYLNIWKASDDEASLKPVLVWIHGGSFQMGATSNPYYSGEKFVRDNPDIIFVSVGYRLGIMGFIDFSQVSGGTNYPDSGNLGLLDMMQALRWLNENIASFGGDKDNITLMGQSAGAACVSMLMTIPESKNLFRRAILESGTVSMHTRKSDALPLAQKLLEATNKTDMAGLASLTKSELLDAIETLQNSANFPETDERILSKDLYEAFSRNAGSFDILIGTNADELNYWKLPLSDESFDQLTSGSFLLTEYAVSQYSSDDVMRMEEFAYVTSDDYPEFFNELLFRGPAIQLAQSHTGNTYMYYWEYPAQYAPYLLACHESELPYFLDNPAGVSVIAPNPDANVQARVQSVVSNFIKTGSPSTASTTWPKYDTQTRTTMIFTETGSTQTDNDPLSTTREIIMPLLKWGVSGRELVNGDLSSGISIDPDAAPEPEPGPEPNPNPTPGPDNPDSGDVTPQRIGSSGGGCDSGFSIVSALMLLMLMRRKK